jgi:hypothetical protein
MSSNVKYKQMVSSPDKLENLGALAYEVEVRLKENVQTLGHVQENSLFLPSACWTFQRISQMQLS